MEGAIAPPDYATDIFYEQPHMNLRNYTQQNIFFGQEYQFKMTS